MRKLCFLRKVFAHPFDFTALSSLLPSVFVAEGIFLIFNGTTMEKTNPVKGSYKTIAGKSVYENSEYRDVLTSPDGKGRNPLDLDPDLLDASGHPRRTLAELRRAFAHNAAGEYQADDYPSHITSQASLEEHCRSCAGEFGVRNCAIINCPLWSRRMGNPYHGGRGHTFRGKPLDTSFSTENPVKNCLFSDDLDLPLVTLPEGEKEAEFSNFNDGPP